MYNSLVKPRKFILGFLHDIESSSTSTSMYKAVLTAIFAIILRCFLESFSQKSLNYFNLPGIFFIENVIHELLFYFITAFVFAITLFYAINETIINLSKMIFCLMVFLLLAPAIDIIASGGGGYDMFYFDPVQTNLFRNFLTYSYYHPGATIGIKIETLLIFSFSYLYLRHKGKGTFESVIYVFILYSFVFILSASPSIIKFVLDLFSYEYKLTNHLLINFFSIIFIILFMWYLFLMNRATMIMLIYDSRLLRVGYYWLLLLLGVAIASKNVSHLGRQLHYGEHIINIIYFMMAIFFGAIFSIITNNIEDIKIDEVSNPGRPLIKGQIEISVYAVWGYAAMLISVYFAALVGMKSLFIMLAILGMYYIYSVPPLRVKQYMVISKLVVSFASLACIIQGYLLVADNLIGFPKVLYPICLLGITMCANLIDIKDVDGDGISGIKTLPVVFGLPLTKKIVGVACICTYASFYFIVNCSVLTALLIMLGMIQYYFINYNTYREDRVLVLNAVALVIVLVYLAAF